MTKTVELSAETFLRSWAKGSDPKAAAASIVLMQMEDYKREFDEATKLTRDIHQKLKRGERTQDHGLIGNLRCILDHVCSKDDPPPL